jgi:hypothetical protein
MWFLLAIASISAAAEGPAREPWAVVLRAPSNHRERVTLEFGTLGLASRRPDRLAYYVRRTMDRLASRSTEIRWADSVSCPAVTEVLAGLRDVQTPRIDVPGFPGRPGGLDETLAIDGTMYRLDMRGRLGFATNEGSALARWTDNALARLEPCWRVEAPHDRG